LGHAAFAAIGAYAAAWITIPLMTRKIFLPDLPLVLLGIEAGLPGGLVLGMRWPGCPRWSSASRWCG